MEMENVSADLELPEPSFELSYCNQDNVIISHGPKNGFLWRGEEADPNNLIASLNKVFQTGFTSDNEHSPLAKLPYIQFHPDFVCASNTYRSGEEFIGFDNEEASAGEYGFTYLIDTSKKNIQSIPLCKENLKNSTFIAGYTGEGKLTEGPDYAIISKVDPKHIIGAVPSAFVAFALGINEKSFIKNPAYKEIFSCEKIKEVIGEEFLLIAPERLGNPDLPLSEVYQHYLQADEMAAQSCLSTGVDSTTFFQRQSIPALVLVEAKLQHGHVKNELAYGYQ